MSKLCIKCRVIGYYHTSFTCCHCFIAKKTVGRYVREISYMPSSDFSAKSFGAVFDKIQIMLSGDLLYCWHITWVTVYVYGHDSFCVCCYMTLNKFTIQLPTKRLYVDKNWYSANIVYCID